MTLLLHPPPPPSPNVKYSPLGISYIRWGGGFNVRGRGLPYSKRRQSFPFDNHGHMSRGLGFRGWGLTKSLRRVPCGNFHFLVNRDLPRLERYRKSLAQSFRKGPKAFRACVGRSNLDTALG